MKLPKNMGILLSFMTLILCGCGIENETDFIGSGTLEADEITVSALMAGQVDSVHFDEGEVVTASDLLVRIDIRKLEAQLHQTEAVFEELGISRRIAQNAVDQAEEQLRNITTTLERQQKLLDSGSSTTQIVDDLKTQQVLAESQLHTGRAQLNIIDAKQKQIESTIQLVQLQIEDGTITSPISGNIIEKYVESGENVAPGSPVAKIVNLDRMWIKVYLNEIDVGSIKLGSSLNVSVDALPDSQFDGVVTWVSSKAEFTPRNVQTKEQRADLVYAVKVEFDNPDQRALIGMPAEVSLP